tara:strand:- start:516 stop:1046 length:531 start_codon:yes stop_codon:yes gene_type:complete
MAKCFSDIPDSRQQSKCTYSQHHFLMSAFACMFFKDFHEKSRRHKHLEDYAILPNVLMCTIDGTQYHSSNSVHCDGCLTKEHKSGELTYSHGVLQSAIMHPDKKQDCELNTAKRFIANLTTAHLRQKFMLCGDGLMLNQSMIEETIAGDMHYLFVAKPGNHKYLVAWLSAYDALSH